MKKIFFVLAYIFLPVLFISCSANSEGKNDYKSISGKKEEKIKADEVNTEYQMKLNEILEMMEQHPKSAKLYAERANIYVLMKKITQALHDISMAVELDPENAEYRTNKAQLLRQFKRNSEALKELNKALELDPNSVAAHFNRGALYFNTNMFDKALEDFSFCIEKRPEVAPPYFNRAFTNEQLHNMKEAKSDLKKFLELSKNKEWKKIAEGKLEEWDKIDYKTIIKEEDRINIEKGL